MALVAGKPIICHIFEPLLASAGVEEIHVTFCHLANVLSAVRQALR